MKSINLEGGFFFWRVEFFKIGKCDVTFISEMRVLMKKIQIEVGIIQCGPCQIEWMVTNTNAPKNPRICIN